MKHLFFAAFIILLASCKKDKSPAESTPAFKKNLISVSAPGQSEWNMFYTNDRKLLSFSNNEMNVTYKPGIPFSAKKTQSGYLHEYKNAVQDAQGRVTKLERFVSGLVESKQEFKYNAEGYLIEQAVAKANNFAKYVYEYQNGNVTTVTVYEGGAKAGSFVFDYYTNLINPIQIDLFDYKGIQFVTDAQFGKQSKNLLKTAKIVHASGQVLIEVDLSYTTDADGYIQTITQSVLGQAPTTFTCSFQ
jgi:uncharacterized protein (UPF0333 family)